MGALPKTLSLVVALLHAGCFEPRTRVELVVIDQDINQNESATADSAIKALLGMPSVQMVICRRDGLYEVHGRDGKVHFRRVQRAEGYRYEVERQEGKNPIEHQDPRALPDLAAELAAGDNPLGTDYSQQDSGYSGPDDPRIFFLNEEKVSYPLAYERIAAMFDGEHVGDLVVEFTPWGWYPMGNHGGLDNVGAHGPLDIVSSRAPLIFAGKGAKKKQVIDGWATSVDIAPTVARAMGIATTFGVDHTGHYSDQVYFKWQDGEVLEQALDGEQPGHVLILVNDALTNSELMHQLAGARQLPTYRWLVEQGTLYRYGQIVNYPTNTFASHNTIGSSAWSGHHGLIDNWFYNRRTGERHDPLTQVFDTGKFLVDEVETLHEAVHRSFGNWDPEKNPLGNYTLSINGPSTRGADHAMLEGMQPIDWDQCPEPQGLKLPALDSTISQRAQAADNLALTIFAKAYLGTRTVDGRTVRCTHPPRYTIINLGLTDDVAHEMGPHSDGLRRAIVQCDQRQQVMFDVLRQAGVLDDTLIVFTSDHGQLLQDNKRNLDFVPVLRKAGIGFRATNAFIYLLTFDVSISPDRLSRGEPAQVELLVRDDDTREPVSGAKVTLTSGSAAASGETDAMGRVRLSFTPAADETTVTVKDHSSVEEEDRHSELSKTFR